VTKSILPKTLFCHDVFDGKSFSIKTGFSALAKNAKPAAVSKEY